MARTVYDELADRLRGLMHTTAREASPPVDRATVKRSDPLVVELLSADESVLLEEGDPDVEIDRGVLAERPDEGDTVRVHKDGSDYVIAGVID